jgi:hypothetical protein
MKHHIQFNVEAGSLLAYNFNLLWCRALNLRQSPTPPDRFVMMHSDIEAESCWMDKLLDEMDRLDADVLSCVIPIKDARGLTSTGLMDPGDKHIRRLTMGEVVNLPETFCADDTDDPGHWLMLNTGLFAVNFKKPWVEEVCFNIVDQIYSENKRFWPVVLSEDWNFSRWCVARGLKIFATRKIKIIHHGLMGYPNTTAWGDLQRDVGDCRNASKDNKGVCK